LRPIKRSKANAFNFGNFEKKKWYIVLGVFAPIPNMRKPELKTAPKTKSH
jgi:hypothetical protein